MKDIFSNFLWILYIVQPYTSFTLSELVFIEGKQPLIISYHKNIYECIKQIRKETSLLFISNFSSMK